jgi:hypothetical protein
MGSFVNNIPGLLSQLTGSVTSAVTQAGLVTVEDMFKKRTAEDIEKRTISIQQIGALIQDIEQVSFLSIYLREVSSLLVRLSPISCAKSPLPFKTNIQLSLLRSMTSCTSLTFLNYHSSHPFNFIVLS